MTSSDNPGGTTSPGWEKSRSLRFLYGIDLPQGLENGVIDNLNLLACHLGILRGVSFDTDGADR